MIINLTQHQATQEQFEAGVVEPANKKLIQELLTFPEKPGPNELEATAVALAGVAVAERVLLSRAGKGSWWWGPSAMIGGAPFLMSRLIKELQEVNITPLYAFSVRESVDEPQPDGGIKKIVVFKHRGFIPATAEQED